jgi:hypothetical protein
MARGAGLCLPGLGLALASFIVTVEAGEVGSGANVVVDPTACASGFTWRQASPDDLICVTPQARARTLQENTDAASRVDSNGAYGQNSCKAGYVWREAYEGDLVCVTPAIRQIVREENRQGPSRLLKALPAGDDGKPRGLPIFVALQTREENGWTVLDETCARRISAGNGDQVQALGCARATPAGYVRRRIFNVDGRWIRMDALEGVGEEIAIVGNGDAVTITTDGRVVELLSTGWGNTRLDGCMRQAAPFGDGLVALSCVETLGDLGIVVRDRETTCMITDLPGGGCQTQDFGQKAIVGGAVWLATDLQGEQLWAISNGGAIKRTQIKGACRGNGPTCILKWNEIPGCARRVAVQQIDAGPDWPSRPQVWALGCAQREGGGFDVIRWRNGAWQTVEGAATEISLSSDSVFIIDPKGRVLRRGL